jgi:hypothetical protein
MRSDALRWLLLDGNVLIVAADLVMVIAAKLLADCPGRR